MFCSDEKFEFLTKDFYFVLVYSYNGGTLCGLKWPVQCPFIYLLSIYLSVKKSIYLYTILIYLPILVFPPVQWSVVFSKLGIFLMWTLLFSEYIYIYISTTVKPLITNTSKEFIKCSILHFLIMECCRYLVF